MWIKRTGVSSANVIPARRPLSPVRVVYCLPPPTFLKPPGLTSGIRSYLNMLEMESKAQYSQRDAYTS